MEYLFSYGSGGNWDVADQALANLVQESWANFAKYGYFVISQKAQKSYTIFESRKS
jgi:hypothetical protein